MGDDVSAGVGVDANRSSGRCLAVKVLGPLSVSVDGSPVLITSGRLRTLLVAMALSADEEVSVDRLAEIVWDATVPSHSRRAAQLYVTRLRKLVGPEAIVTTPGGYRLHVDPVQVDAIRFERLLDAAAADDPAVERAALVQALALWRGVPFDGLRSVWLENVEASRLTVRYLAALERRVELDLDLGHGAELVAELLDLTARYPLRERLWGHLMTALYRSGQQADALAAYQRLYRLLADELGIEPGPAVQGLHRQILTARADSGHPGRRVVAVPRQLPGDVAAFTGRVNELADLDRVADANAVVITAIDGMAGIGKTALAVHIAHRVAGRYPDGQLFIDLHGYTQGVEPVDPVDALDHMLRSLGVAGAQIPARVEERAALYRTRLADRRMLILLDNAATEAQVEPLLPGAPGCLVLITSRRRLAGLDHTHTLSLDTLPPADAVAVLCLAAGEGRLVGQPAPALAELVELCGRLPLAIRIAAARLRSHSTWDPARLVQRLRDQQQRLGELQAGQRSVTAALDLSYHHLTGDQQRMYRRLGLHPGPDFEAHMAAALIDAGPSAAGRLLDQLHEAHLLQESVPGRYRFHDLTRDHAAHIATRDETGRDAQAALDRLFDHYRSAVSSAMDAAYPYDQESRPPAPPARNPLPALSGPAALAWLDGELANLLATARYASEHGRATHVLHLSTSLRTHLRDRGRYQEAETLHQQALAAARSIGERAGEMEALAGLGRIHLRQGRHDVATDELRRALEIARATGNTAGQREVLHDLGWVQLYQGGYECAADYLRQVLELARATGDCPGEVDALAGLGHVYRLAGQDTSAATHFRQAVRRSRALGHGRAERRALAGLGAIHLHQGRYEQAADNYQMLLDLAQDGCDPNWQFEARQGLGRLQHTTGHPDVALGHHDQALTLAHELGQPTDEARAHDGLAHAYHALHQPERARTHWQIALDILTELGADHTDEEVPTVATLQAHLVDPPGLFPAMDGADPLLAGRPSCLWCVPGRNHNARTALGARA